MPLLNFKRMFVEPIREGRKNHTIRADRKIPVKPGDKLFLYCGLRHKGAFRILAEPVICTKALPIRIILGLFGNYVEIDGQELSADERESLARADGFQDWAGMRAFWEREHGKPTGGGWAEVEFTGQIIHWHPAVHPC